VYYNDVLARFSLQHWKRDTTVVDLEVWNHPCFPSSSSSSTPTILGDLPAEVRCFKMMGSVCLNDGASHSNHRPPKPPQRHSPLSGYYPQCARQFTYLLTCPLNMPMTTKIT
jgi:hypothetical protein